MAEPLSELHFTRNLPSPKLFGTDSLVIYDRKLLRAVPNFKKWVDRFPVVYGVQSGERLKDVAHFPGHMAKLIRATQHLSPRDMTIVVAGGGSVGDFGGFVASIFKRGVSLVHVPTTWLAAIDSSHGGKTALNVGAAKNQLGTFYSANSIYLVSSILKDQPRVRALDAMGELAKMLLIDGGAFAQRFVKHAEKKQQSVEVEDLAWRFLNEAVRAKYKVVKCDPREVKGHRQVLNLGHTLGHILEAQMQLPHGTAVGQGLYFALNWSRRRNYLSNSEFESAIRILEICQITPMNETKKYRAIRPSVRAARVLLSKDKKRQGRDRTTFIFLKRIGRPFRDAIRNEDLFEEAKLQGWLR